MSNEELVTYTFKQTKLCCSHQSMKLVEYVAYMGLMKNAFNER